MGFEKIKWPNVQLYHGEGKKGTCCAYSTISIITATSHAIHGILNLQQLDCNQNTFSLRNAFENNDRFFRAQWVYDTIRVNCTNYKYKYTFCIESCIIWFRSFTPILKCCYGSFLCDHICDLFFVVFFLLFIHYRFVISIFSAETAEAVDSFVHQQNVVWTNALFYVLQYLDFDKNALRCICDASLVTSKHCFMLWLGV